MSEWLVVLFGLIGFSPEPPQEMIVEPAIELSIPEMAGADRQFVRFDDRAAGVGVQRLIMRKDQGLAIVDYRVWKGGYALNDPWAAHSPLFSIGGAGRATAPRFSGGSGDLEWRFFPALSRDLDCLAIKRPLQVRDDPGNVAKVVEADVVAALCLRQGTLTERDAWRVAEAIEINDPGPRATSGVFQTTPRRFWRILPSPPSAK